MMIKKILEPGKGRVLALLLFLMTGPAWGDPTNTEFGDGLPSNDTISLNEANSGALLFYNADSKSYTKAPELSMRVDMKITGIIAKTGITQVFANPHGDWLEATYVFPLPETASVNRFRLILADRIVEARIMEKDEAKKIYEEAKENGEQVALLEEKRPNMFMTSVANIPPFEKVTVELEYIDTLVYDAGACSVRIPLVITPRYNPDSVSAGKTELGNALEVMSQIETQSAMKGYTGAKITTFNETISGFPVLVRPILYPGEGLRNPTDIKITLDAGFDLENFVSLYHEVRVARIGKGSYSVELSRGSVPADRDFVLVWKPVADGIFDAACFVEEKNGSYYSLAMIIPPPANRVLARLPREVIFVLDRSGSMYGSSIEQAKGALAEGFGKLDIADSFGLVVFNNSYTFLFDGCVGANEANRSKALDFIRNMRAEGGTEMKRALEAALAIPHDPGKLRQIVFITDGAVSNEAELLGIIRNNLGDGRLFTVGIGSAPNTFFMRKAAEIGKGTTVYIGDTSEVKEKISALFSRIEKSILTNMRIACEDNHADTVPSVLPDLYSGEAVVLVSKLAGPGGTIRFSGSYAENGFSGIRSFSRDLNMTAARKGSCISAIWASKKITSLLDCLYEGEKEDGIKPQVVSLALEHGIVTPYTSYVAVEQWKIKPKKENLASGKVPLDPPHGSANGQAQGFLGKAGTLSDLSMLAGCILLFCSTVFLIAIHGRKHGKSKTT